MKIAVVGVEHLAEAIRAECALHFELVSIPEHPDLVWFAVNVSVDHADRPDVDALVAAFDDVASATHPITPILISSQLPVGTTSKWQADWPTHHLAYQPENIRRQHARDDFHFQNRMIVGTNWPEDIPLITQVLSKFTPGQIHFMTPESAEMVKHTLNAWLAMNICFANEIKDICVEVGADVSDVFAGFRSDRRVSGPLEPGEPITGGTLLRDVRVLLETDVVSRQGNGPLLEAIQRSNWIRL